MRAVWVVLVLVGVWFSRGSEACSCAPTHPQDQFCRAAFVIKASVVNKQYIYEPTQKPTTKPTTQPAAEPTAPEFSPVLEKENELVFGNQAEVPNKTGRIGPASMLAGQIPSIGLSDFPGHRPVQMNTEENRPIKLEYTVKVEKVFKGDEYILERTLAKIYTQPNDGICGRTDLTEDASYVIAGSFYDNELHISSCSWIVPYKSLTRIQRRGVKLMYKQGCGDCSIATCYGRTCTFAQPGNDTCMFDISTFGNSCESQHSLCSRSKKVCKWQRTRDYKECQRALTGHRRGGKRVIP